MLPLVHVHVYTVRFITINKQTCKLPYIQHQTDNLKPQNIQILSDVLAVCIVMIHTILYTCT